MGRPPFLEKINDVYKPNIPGFNNDLGFEKKKKKIADSLQCVIWTSVVVKLLFVNGFWGFSIDPRKLHNFVWKFCLV